MNTKGRCRSTALFLCVGAAGVFAGSPQKYEAQAASSFLQAPPEIPLPCRRRELQFPEFVSPSERCRGVLLHFLRDSRLRPRRRLLKKEGDLLPQRLPRLFYNFLVEGLLSGTLIRIHIHCFEYKVEIPFYNICFIFRKTLYLFYKSGIGRIFFAAASEQNEV